MPTQLVLTEAHPYFEIWKSGSLTIFTAFDGDDHYPSNSVRSVYDLQQYCLKQGYTDERTLTERESGARIWRFYHPEDAPPQNE